MRPFRVFLRKVATQTCGAMSQRMVNGETPKRARGGKANMTLSECWPLALANYCSRLGSETDRSWSVILMNVQSRHQGCCIWHPLLSSRSPHWLGQNVTSCHIALNEYWCSSHGHPRSVLTAMGGGLRHLSPKKMSSSKVAIGDQRFTDGLELDLPCSSRGSISSSLHLVLTQATHLLQGYQHNIPPPLRVKSSKYITTR